MAWVESTPSDAATSSGTVLAGELWVTTTDDTAWTWTELIASTGSEWAGFQVDIGSDGSQARAGALKIGIGAAGAESTISIMPVRLQERSQPVSVFVPVTVAAGTRISTAMRVSNTGGASKRVVVTGYPSSNIGGTTSFSVMEAGPFGGGATSSYGYDTSITVGSTPNTLSAWTEVGPGGASEYMQGTSLPNDYEWLGLALIKAFATSASGANAIFQLGIGPAGSETVIGEWATRDSGDGFSPGMVWLRDAGAISQGSRIAVRGQADAQFTVGLVLLGLR